VRDGRLARVFRAQPGRVPYRPTCARATRDIGEDGDLKFPAVGG